MAVKVKEIELTGSSGDKFKIGLSDTLNNLTTAEIWESGVAGFTDNRFAAELWKAYKSKSPFTNDTFDGPTDKPTSLEYVSMTGGPPNYSGINLKSANNDMSEKLYAKLIFVYNDSVNTYDELYLQRTKTALSDFRIITNLDLTHMGYCVSLNDTVAWTGATRRANWTAKDVPLFTQHFYYRYYFNTIGIGNYYEFPANKFIPYMLFKYDDKLFAFRLTYNSFRAQVPDHCPLSTGGGTYTFNRNMYDIDNSGNVDDGYSFAFNFGVNKEISIISAKNNTKWVYDNGYGYSFIENAYSTQYLVAPSEIATINDYHKNLGMYFITDKVYKPIVENGIITGYTDDLTKESEFDNFDYESGTAHDVPDEPKPYPDSDNKIEGMNYRLANQLGGFTTYYKVTRDDLARIINSVNHPSESNPLPDGYEFLPHVVSVAQYPFNVSQYVHGTASNVVIGGYDTGVSALSLDSTQLAVQDIATIKIPAKYGNFLDKSPYTQLELYIPLCGWVVLPDTVVGNSITVSLCVDPVNLGCIGKVTMNGLTIAEKCGKMGTSISISATENGLKNAALTQAIFNVMGATLSTGYALSTGNPVGAVSGVMSVAGAISQGNIANNSNYTRAVGNTGDMSENHISNTCYLKITFPLADTPANFGHTYGYMCNEAHKLSECSGFTVCDNPDLSGINATENEKQRLKALLTSGIYC